MKILSRKALAAAFCACLASAPIATVNAQSAKATVQQPSFDDLPSPEFSGGKQKSFKPKDWLEIETKINVQLSPEPKSKTCDRVTVKWYVAVSNPDKRGTMWLLTRNVEHVNVPLGEDVWCSVYLSPASVTRLTGSAKGGKRAVEAVGVEVLVNGEKVGEETTRFKTGWWNAASGKISRSDVVPLLTKPETPFSNMWWDRYAEVRAERR